ncbi:MAG: putative glycoside hydrolase [candidate division KSB1 bacterium]|nr:putative glycoside hydrolase [candidate division KSB1 bacterium]MDZ7275333.1 putative glycoside hydrolase [candidate division KSB1 bacterium]MDZ7287500.1 putative glycoside hydrolase [candidate division KSB1 bacterium]MDZ7299614.1 putative glycoside hydrolase [candidate division KSB1 bacterium]MDZ7307407.1 putative glycoside hydrolase [candidate division KSB1 bacterium]
MKRYLLFLLTLTLCGGPHPAARAQTQIHALWGFTPEGPFAGTPKETAAALYQNNINAVFVDTIAPELHQTLKAIGVKIYTTVNVFGSSVLWRRHPQLRPVDRQGNRVAAEPGNGICPTQRSFWPRLLRQIAQKRDAGFDGIWLDFLRFSGHWETPNPELLETCFCDSTLADFERRSGLVIPENLPMDTSTDGPAGAKAGLLAARANWILTHHRREWMLYKTAVIADFARQAQETIAKKPGVIMGLFAVPWQREEYGRAITNVLGQDYRRLSSHFDVFSPMLYHELCGRPVEWISQFVQYTASETNKPVWPIIQTDLGSGHNVPDDEFSAAVLHALEAPAGGVIIFRQQTLLQAKQLAILRASWQ